jgi:hypothetical protein
MKEIFKVVPGYADYSVSNKGNVVSRKRGRTKLLNENRSGGVGQQYYSVTLRKDMKSRLVYIHQLVAMAFLDHNPNGYKLVIHHIDGNHFNNNVNNLQVVTHRENMSKRKDSKKFTGVCKNVNGDKYTAIIRVDGKNTSLGSSFKTAEDASRAYKEKLKSINP